MTTSMIKTAVFGLPLNPTHLLAELAGASFCVSYATRDKLGKQLDQAIDLVGEDGILLVDNGAFSLHKQGVSARDESYLEGYEAWAGDILARCPQAIAVIPDVIGGTEAENADLVATTLLDCERAMPIWHMHESIDYFLYLCESFGYVGIGSSGEFWQVGTPKWQARMTEAMDALGAWEQGSNGAYIRPRLHLMRAQSQAHLFGLDSSDSTNVAMNHGRYRAEGTGHVARFAARAAAKIVASSGEAAEHQLKRPLLDHLEAAAWRASMAHGSFKTETTVVAEGAVDHLAAEFDPVLAPTDSTTKTAAHRSFAEAEAQLYALLHRRGSPLLDDPAALRRHVQSSVNRILGQSRPDPVVVSYGAGLNSTALLIEMHRRGYPAPDLIMFADTGSELQRTYDYLPIINTWLRSVGWPEVTVVKNASPIAGDASLYDECHRKSVLPSLAYGHHSCSLKWKAAPQDRHARKVFGWDSRGKRWAHRGKVIRLVGYDAGPADQRRYKNAQGKGEPGYEYRYPLIEWNIDRDGCERIVREAGLPLPGKSSCWFCPAMHKEEVSCLAVHHPELAAKAAELEARAHARGLRTVKGLGRRWSWTEHLGLAAPTRS